MASGRASSAGWESSQVDFTAGNMHVSRLKGSTDAVHPIRGDELRALRRLQREQSPKSAHSSSPASGAPFTPAGFRRMVQRTGDAAKLGFRDPPAHAEARGWVQVGQ